LTRRDLRRRKMRENYIKLKSGKCLRCGCNNVDVLEFHHPFKTENKGRDRKGKENPRNKSFNLNVVALMCRNCHRKIHRNLRKKAKMK